MISIILGKATHQINSHNIHKEGDNYQLWITRPNDKNLKIKESTNENEIVELKEAIDYAIKHGQSTFEIEPIR